MAEFVHKNYTYKGYAWPLYIDKTKLEDGLLNTFKFRQDDVIVTGFPKSGNTWMLFLLQELYPDLNVFEHGEKRIPPMIMWLLQRSFNEPTPLQKTVISFKHDPDATPSPRLIKSHLPYEVFPKQAFQVGAKVIYITRNPKDVAVSSYHWHAKTNRLRGKLTWEDHLSEFVNDKLPFTPWVDHVAGWREHGQDENVFHVTYEDMIKYTKKTVYAITEFLGRSLPESRIESVILKTSIDNLRNNPESASKIDMDEEIMSGFAAAFFRKGVVGDWKNQFTVAENEMFEVSIDKKIREKGVACVYKM
ncbi:sulfotransferase 1A3-like [Saccoglossus kowalevskii]|uniref:Sulfotransferase 1A3/1A4-like n=1 Tax=Saccoglossus kowalevskii TaxID=10224 RepID=A0ABM0GNG8_SACKO|nr:PREDICTED: sulfotransferase 1A3/1A4-like [Saccoglossus kowalevskii]